MQFIDDEAKDDSSNKEIIDDQSSNDMTLPDYEPLPNIETDVHSQSHKENEEYNDDDETILEPLRKSSKLDDSFYRTFSNPIETPVKQNKNSVLSTELFNEVKNLINWQKQNKPSKEHILLKVLKLLNKHFE